MSSEVQPREILGRLERIESSLAAIGGQLQRKAHSEEALEILSDGLALYRRRILEQAGAAGARAQRREILERASGDRALGLSERKILDCLLRHDDPLTAKFCELTFSQLVRQARVGKSRAKAYLACLESRGYISRRDDGYRKWFCIRPPARAQ